MREFHLHLKKSEYLKSLSIYLSFRSLSGCVCPYFCVMLNDDKLKVMMAMVFIIKIIEANSHLDHLVDSKC